MTASPDVERAFFAWSTACAWTAGDGDRATQRALFDAATADPGTDPTERAKTELFFGIGQAPAMGISRGSVREDVDCAMLHAVLDFTGGGPPKRQEPGAIFLIRQAGRWRVLLPYGDPLASATVRNLPPDQQGRLAKLAAELKPEARRPADTQDELNLAIAASDAMGVKRAVDASASWTGRSRYLGTPLLAAVACDRPEMVRLALEHGAVPSGEKPSLLVRAIRRGQTAVAEQLIGASKDVNTPDGPPDLPPLAEALQSGNQQLAKALFAAGAKIDPSDKRVPLLHYAAVSGDYDTFAWAKQFYPDLKQTIPPNVTVLHALAFGNPMTLGRGNGDGRIAKELLDGGVDPKAPRGLRHNIDVVETALVMAASRRDRTATVLALLDHAKFTPAELSWGLSRAVRSGTAGGVRALVKAGAPRTGQGWSAPALYAAAGVPGHGEMLGLLLDAGCPVDERRPKSNRTALHVAAARGDAENVRVLLARGADVAALDAVERSPLDLARERVTNGREKDSLRVSSPEYDSELPGRAEDGIKVLATLEKWYADHPDAAKKADAAKRDAPRVASRPAATPEAAVRVFIEACVKNDRAAAESAVLLSDDARVRRRILDYVEETLSRMQAAETTGAKIDGTLAVVEVRSRDAKPADNPGNFFAVRRDGGWLVFWDRSGFGPPADCGLAPHEREIVARYVEAAWRR